MPSAKQERRARKKAARDEARARREHERARTRDPFAEHNYWKCGKLHCATCWYGYPELAMARSASFMNHGTHEQLGVRAFDCFACA